MKVTMVGAGYVGLVSGACLADVGNEVCCVDKNASKIDMLKAGRIPIHEPLLEDIIRNNVNENRMSFTTDVAYGLKDSDICFIAVDTPPSDDDSADLRNIFAVAESIGSTLDHRMIVATKSTIPVGTTMKIKNIISNALLSRGLDPHELLNVASNPEFLKEGDAVNDFMKPDRIIVGTEKDFVADIMHDLYRPFMIKADRFLRMSIPSAELAKYAANSMLATRISFMNEMARLCEKVGADIDEVRAGLARDPRIGPDFLYAGLGYGGSCFPKDTLAIADLGKKVGSRLPIVESANEVNLFQREWFLRKIFAHFGGQSGVSGKKIAIWGVAFKPYTDDVRYSPALYLIEKLLDSGASISAFDPVAVKTAKAALGARSSNVLWAEHDYECLEGADALIVCTEWREFRSPDFKKIKALMVSPVIFDGRNIFDPKSLAEKGFKHIDVGRRH